MSQAVNTAKMRQKIQSMADKIAQEFKPEKIILFGSWAWGTPHEDSDVDLFIVKESNKKRWEREYDLRMKLIGNKFPPMDLLIYTPEEMEQRIRIEDLFIQDILKNGKLVYVK